MSAKLTKRHLPTLNLDQNVIKWTALLDGTILDSSTISKNNLKLPNPPETFNGGGMYNKILVII